MDCVTPMHRLITYDIFKCVSVCECVAGVVVMNVYATLIRLEVARQLLLTL